MSGNDAKAAAEQLRRLHQEDELLLVPNAFDAASARVLERVGFPTIATSSAAMAWAAGLPDGERLSFEAALEQHARAARAVKIPVSADFESGYVSGSGGIDETIRALVGAGFGGVNLEDTAFNGSSGPLRDADEHAELIARARSAAESLDVPLFLNGRTDVFLRSRTSGSERLEEAIDRLRRYVAAGADCVFAPGICGEQEIAALVKALDTPVNVMHMPTTPPPSRLRELGVRRLTFGVGFYLASLATVESVGRALRGDDLQPLERAQTLSAESLDAIAA
jgi:2-methylisocitrate lyase-like PEP mutase family enzyme